jgi:ATP-dependent RNA circularization protein (DNA/RNA ligase family)
MIEYPTILPSAKAPRQPCVAFDKLDGSNIRVKYTQKKGFHLFGSRTQLIDHTHPHLGGVVSIFNEQFNDPLTKLIKKEYPNEREVIVFGEYFGPKSFAGYHEPGDQMEFVLFDIMVGHKNRKFLNPKDFVKIASKYSIKIPRVIYEGNLNDQLIQDVRAGKYDVVEGVICKGTIKTGAACGSIWRSKIKTQSYLDRLFARYGEEGLQKYGE